MKTCEIPKRDTMINTIQMKIDKPDLPFESAKRMAKNQAKAYCSDATLLSWYDRDAAQYFPHEGDCSDDQKPSWVTYAMSRGGNLTIDINQEDYVFIFRGKQGLS